jgi:hypothetical protein
MSACATWLVAVALAGALAGADTPFAWKSVNIQGMGYVTGLAIHPLAPHDVYIRTDVGGAYRFDRGGQRWLPISDRTGMGAAGFEAIGVDPTDSNTVYGSAGVVSGTNSYAEVFVSHSRGAYWVPTGLASLQLYIGANDAYRGNYGRENRRRSKPAATHLSRHAAKRALGQGRRAALAKDSSHTQQPARQRRSLRGRNVYRLR